MTVESKHWLPKRIGIVGVGLLGGSVALAARRAWPHCVIAGSSRNPATRKQLVESDVVNEAFDSAEQCVSQCDIVIIAAPVGNIASLLPKIASHCGSGAIITDVGSTKALIVAAAETDDEASRRFVGSHPIAGSEQTGASNGRADLFDGKITVVTPTDKTDQLRREKVKRFWTALGSKVIEMTPASHDEMLAAASHMPHIASAALASVLPKEADRIVGTGFRDTTRIAAGDPVMWRQIVEANGPATCNQVARLIAALKDYQAAIASKDWDRVERLFEQGKEAKRRIDRTS